MKQLYCGIDIHKESFYGVILDKEDRIVESGKYPNNKEAVQTFLAGIPASRIKITIEACGIWRGYYRTLTELGYSVILANPVKTKEIAGKKKTDKVDANTLAELLRTNFLPKVYIPTEGVMKLRDIARHRARLVRLRTQIQGKIKAYMLRDGTKFPKGLWTVNGMKWLTHLNDQNIANFTRIYSTLNAEIKEVTGRVNKIARNRDTTNLLQSIPGIGSFSSLLTAAEIADISRFDNPKSLVMYGGLCPGIYQSGDKSHNVRNTAVNKWLKWVMYECSGRAAIMANTRYSKHYHRMKKRRNMMVARRSTARRMLTDVYWVLKNEIQYKES